MLQSLRAFVSETGGQSERSTAPHGPVAAEVEVRVGAPRDGAASRAGPLLMSAKKTITTSNKQSRSCSQARSAAAHQPTTADRLPHARRSRDSATFQPENKNLFRRSVAALLAVSRPELNHCNSDKLPTAGRRAAHAHD